MDPLTTDILSFWFGSTDLTSEMEKRPVWFKSTPEFDRHLIENFTETHERAVAGALDRLQGSPADCLALIIALDQFPRNIYRGTMRAFAADAKAREVARFAVENGYDGNFARWPKTFTYLPFEHSENLADQEFGLKLFATIGTEEAMVSARDHCEAIRRFGRFPHRNDILGRENTAEEEEYLRDPPTWGKTAAEADELQKRKSAETKAGQAAS